MKDTDEFSFLKETFKSLGNQYFDSSGIIVGPGDDAGLVKNTQETIYSVDTSVAGVHFPENLPPEHIAYRSVSTAASDIVACGGVLKWILVALTVENSDLAWMRNFVKGLKKFSDDYACPVLGGDLSKGKQQNVAVTVCGAIDQENFMSRDGAKIGDQVFVTGALGLAKQGLTILKSNSKEIDLSSKYVSKFINPNLNFKFGQAISSYATSCIDVSDGFISDLGHICQASRVGASIDSDLIPIYGELEDALTWGDDYELCFTAPSKAQSDVFNAAKECGVQVSQVGEITEKLELEILQNSRLVSFSKNGYNHLDE
ncbi:MAG: thiamine-phosphate kinase [Pseudomonadota bacterium]|nr:thiamine-phosphate kinase [Pseudomonadota bacterium]